MHSVILVAVASILSAPLREPVWHNDYRQAQKHGLAAKKPLAVVVGSGAAGYRSLCHEAGFDNVKQLLASQYVCVYLDTSRPEGRRLADQFSITRPQGLILSDRTGALQAFHHDGPLAQQELDANLRRFADPQVEVHTTLSNTRTSSYPTENGGRTITIRNC